MPTSPGAHDAHTVPIVLCFDCEPDGFFIDPARRDPWAGFEATFAFVEALRPRVEDATGRRAQVSWFVRMDPQITDTYGAADWPLRHYEREFGRLEAHGDEIGIHPHAYRLNDARDAWTLDYADQGWVDYCVQSAWDTYGRVMGRACRALRFGDRWMNQATAALLARLGIGYDLTLEPGHAAEALPYPPERVTGGLPDLRDVPTHPYRPRADDYRRADPTRDAGPWMIPISTARVRPRLLRRIYYGLRHPSRQVSMWTALLSHNPVFFERIVEDVLARPRPYLAIPMRTNALADPRLRPRVTANVEILLRHMRTHRSAAVTPHDAIGLLSAAAPVPRHAEPV